MMRSYRCVRFMPGCNDNDDAHDNGDDLDNGSGDGGDDEDHEEWTRVTDV